MLGSSSGIRTTELARRGRQGKARWQLCRGKADLAEAEQGSVVTVARPLQEKPRGAAEVQDWIYYSCFCPRFCPGIAALPHASEVHQNTPNRRQEEDAGSRPSALKRLRENERELIRNEPRTLGGSGKESKWCCYGREGDGTMSWPSERGKQEAKQVKQAARQRGGVSVSLSETAADPVTL
ncbi:hypothetical protein NDU88_005432 [Pleurodeles waltl]|uniref:Uncharacterized protein n=1 Tax=Pleurodeles waltl TaxID=8319 RepID=A0AAV7X0M9_PLEWA|nr:hypothetical protein NDU88_005432 [Pleurodeles waltl]